MSKDVVSSGELSPEKKFTKQIFNDAKVELNSGAVFGGFYYREDNSRAERSFINEIRFNEKYLDIPEDEKQRVARHELQHVLNQQEMTSGSVAIWAFTFTEKYREIHARMLEYYRLNIAYGYQFGKRMDSNVATSFQEVLDRGDCYENYDEMLALLKGYETYLRQSGSGAEIKTQPYEFIEAFKPDDLKLLDINYRKSIVEEIGEEKIKQLLPAEDSFSIDL